jgi:hypothetical protein
MRNGRGEWLKRDVSIVGTYLQKTINAVHTQGIDITLNRAPGDLKTMGTLSGCAFPSL